MKTVTTKAQITKAAITENGHLCTYSVKSSETKALAMATKTGYKIVTLKGASVYATRHFDNLAALKLGATVNHF